MTTATYDEAIEAGLSRREASYIAAAHDLKEFLGGLREDQTAFLQEQGLSWEEARALDEQGRADLNARWKDWHKERQESGTAPKP